MMMSTEHDERANLLDIVHEPRAAQLRGGVAAAAQRVHDVAGEDEEQVVGAAVGDGAERAQGHEQHVQPVRERQHAAGGLPPHAGAPVAIDFYSLSAPKPR